MFIYILKTTDTLLKGLPSPRRGTENHSRGSEEGRPVTEGLTGTCSY